VKRLIDRDRRYDKIRSSSEREAIFEEYMKSLEEENKEFEKRKEQEMKLKEKKARFT